MDISSLLMIVALCGQVSDAAALDREARAAELDTPLEAADENSSLDGDPRDGDALDGDALDGPSMEDADGATLEPAIEEAAEAGGAADPGAPAPKNSPDALLQWLAEGDKALEGKPIALVDLLSRIHDRQQRALVIPAYWQLFAAACEYRIAADEASRLGQLLPPADASGRHASHPVLEARMASAEARVREAELAVLAQQYALADHMRLPANEPLPLAADLPHSGAYRTFFQERYARSAPPKMHLIDRTLPLLHRSIELRAAAAVSAADSADAEAEAYLAGQLDLVSVVDSVIELSRQRWAFVAAVRDYNLDIAEYALTVVPAGLTSAQLVGVLIGPPPAAPAEKSDRKELAERRRGVKQAAFESPIDAPPTPRVRVPTLAPPRESQPLRRLPDEASPALKQAPDVNHSPRQKSGRPRRAATPSSSSTSRPRPTGQRHFVAKPPRVEPVESRVGEEQPETTASTTDALPTEADQGLYGGLSELSSLKRAQELSAALHWDEARDPSQGTAVSLADALSAVPAGDWRALLASYWHCRQQIAAWQTLSQEIEQLRALQPVALRRREDAGAADAMLRLRTAQLAASAAADVAKTGILAAQFDLAMLLRRPLDRPWPWPVTSPHAGGYRLKLDAQPATLLQAAYVRQLVGMLPKRHEAVQGHANAVIAADAARVAVLAECEAGERRLSDAVAAVRRLSSETLAFLEAQSHYNVQFADYALAVAPSGVPASVLARALVVQ